MSKKSWVKVIAYRLGQVRQQLGRGEPLSAEERAEVARWLPEQARELFDTMSVADQRHALRVCRGLQEQGCEEAEMLAAALLHDVGKAEGRVPFWTRPTIVIGKRVAPGLLSRLTCYPLDEGRRGWRRSLSYAWYHAEVGADLAAAAGLSPRTVLYIRTHHQPDGPAARLHLVDEVS
jgi:hypothetical protein